MLGSFLVDGRFGVVGVLVHLVADGILTSLSSGSHGCVGVFGNVYSGI